MLSRLPCCKPRHRRTDSPNPWRHVSLPLRELLHTSFRRRRIPAADPWSSLRAALRFCARCLTWQLPTRLGFAARRCCGPEEPSHSSFSFLRFWFTRGGTDVLWRSGCSRSLLRSRSLRSYRGTRSRIRRGFSTRRITSRGSPARSPPTPARSASAPRWCSWPCTLSFARAPKSVGRDHTPRSVPW